MDSKDVEKKLSAVVDVVCIDIGALICSYSLSGESIHPWFPSSWKDLVVRSEDLQWRHSRSSGQVCRAFSRQASGFGETSSDSNLHLDHELLDSCSHHLSVLKRCIPKTLAFAFGLRLRSKTRCFKLRVLGRRLPNGKPQETLRFRDLRSKTLAFKNALRLLFAI